MYQCHSDSNDILSAAELLPTTKTQQATRKDTWLYQVGSPLGAAGAVAICTGDLLKFVNQLSSKCVSRFPEWDNRRMLLADWALL